MAVEDDVREVRGHLMGLVGSFNQFSGRIEQKLEGIVDTLEAHSRPCPDVKEVKAKVEKIEKTLSSADTEENPVVSPKEDRNTLRFVLAKIVVPLIIALTGGFSAVVAYAFATAPKG